MDDLSQMSFRLALIASVIAGLAYWGSLVMVPRLAGVTGAAQPRWRERLSGSARLWALLAALLLVFTLAGRWEASGRPPWSNMWEFTVTFAAAAAVSYVLFERYASGIAVVGGVVQGVIAMLLLAAILFFPARIEPLVPALQSDWILAAHVGFMAISYGALTLSFGAAGLRLVQGDQQRVQWLPSPRTLERMAHTSVVVGFPLLTVGVALGAYWANSAWGRYRGWDPKETASLVTWVLYGAYLHMRNLRGWQGQRAAGVLVVGYAAIIFTYFGVNLWISGLHSYA